VKFGELHPSLNWTAEFGYELSFDCPTCLGKRVVIYVSLDGKPKPPATWGIELLQPPDFSWDKVTITPSINNTGPTRHGRGSPCRAHLTITNGEVILS
jgi:Family of unknown function (DUF6527)